MRPFDAHAAREAWLIAAWKHGDKKTQRVAQMCCWRNVIEDQQRLPEEQRLAMLNEFFSVYPANGDKIAAALNKLGTVDLFVPNQLLADVTKPVLTWAEKLGVEIEGIDRILWEPPRILGLNWQARGVQLRQSLSEQGAGNTYLLRLDDMLVAVIALQRDKQDRTGRMALQEVKLIAQRALWDLALEEDSGWGDLLEVVLMGFWPCGVTQDNRFIISHKSTLGG
jgi:hypothetical protein